MAKIKIEGTGEEIDSFPDFLQTDCVFYRTGDANVLCVREWVSDRIYTFFKRDPQGKWFEVLTLCIPELVQAFWNHGGKEAHEITTRLTEDTLYRLVIESRKVPPA